MRTVVITGASRGIGFAAAKKFLTEGWFVIGTSVSGEIPLDSERFKALKLDYLRPETIPIAVAEIGSLGQKIDVLVNNAGMNDESEDYEGAEVKIPVLRRTLEVNLIGTIDFTERIEPFIPSGGHILSLGSRWGSLADVKASAAPSYAISKAALSMYTRRLAVRLKNKDVAVSIIDPGWVKTDMGGAEAPRNVEEAAAEVYELASSHPETGQFWHRGKKRDW